MYFSKVNIKTSDYTHIVQTMYMTSYLNNISLLDHDQSPSRSQSMLVDS